MITLPRLTDPATRLLHHRAHLALIQDELKNPAAIHVSRESLKVTETILVHRIIMLRREVINDLIHRIGAAKQNQKIVEESLKDNLPREVATSLSVRRLHIMSEIEKMWKDLRYHVESGVMV